MYHIDRLVLYIKLIKAFFFFLVSNVCIEQAFGQYNPLYGMKKKY